MRNATAPAPIRATVAATIRAELARAGISQATAAAWIGVTQPAMSARLHARVPITVDELAAIANGLGLPIETLLVPPPFHAVPKERRVTVDTRRSRSRCHHDARNVQPLPVTQADIDAIISGCEQLLAEAALTTRGI